jgi:hypothetical protein
MAIPHSTQPLIFSRSVCQTSPVLPIITYRDLALSESND